MHMIVVGLPFNHAEVLSFLLFVLFSLFFKDFIFFLTTTSSETNKTPATAPKIGQLVSPILALTAEIVYIVFGLITNASGG
jgi:hypothetical protein